MAQRGVEVECLQQYREHRQKLCAKKGMWRGHGGRTRNNTTSSGIVYMQKVSVEGTGLATIHGAEAFADSIGGLDGGEEEAKEMVQKDQIREPLTEVQERI